MSWPFDRDITYLIGGVTAFLTVATVIGGRLRRRAASESPAYRASMANLNARIASWWVMCAVIVVSLLLGSTGTIALFAVLSFVALREFLTIAPTRRADHRILLFAFFVALPLQYALVASQSYGLFTVLLPICGVLVIPAAAAVAGDTERFTERVAEIQWGLMLCVYCVSYAPALLMLDIPGYVGQNAKLLVYLVVVVEFSDVLQYIWGKLCGHRLIAPTISPAKTVEGLIGGAVSATVLGTALWPLTPFRPWQAAALSMSVTLAGFAGGLIMSAIKRDRGVKDFGTAIAGHGGVLDRIDSLCVAGPLFFHLTRHFFSA